MNENSEQKIREEKDRFCSFVEFLKMNPKAQYDVRGLIALYGFYCEKSAYCDEVARMVQFVLRCDDVKKFVVESFSSPNFIEVYFSINNDSFLSYNEDAE